jgi:cysteine sulfinate desulfinase/cysteine desulfurase-like protein
MDVFACAFCGSQQRVERKGGTVALHKIKGAIKAVQRGTDRTAAELALPRLEKELAEIMSRKAYRLVH